MVQSAWRIIVGSKAGNRTQKRARPRGRGPETQRRRNPKEPTRRDKRQTGTTIGKKRTRGQAKRRADKHADSVHAHTHTHTFPTMDCLDRHPSSPRRGRSMVRGWLSLLRTVAAHAPRRENGAECMENHRRIERRYTHIRRFAMMMASALHIDLTFSSQSSQTTNFYSKLSQ